MKGEGAKSSRLEGLVKGRMYTLVGILEHLRSNWACYGNIILSDYSFTEIA